MALFVHLAPEKDTDSIQRTGIKPRRLKQPLHDGYDRIVFAMPVTDSFFVSHQWLRELKRNGQRTIVGVYFHIPDDQMVMVGHYNQNHQALRVYPEIGIALKPEISELVVSGICFRMIWLQRVPLMTTSRNGETTVPGTKS